MRYWFLVAFLVISLLLAGCGAPPSSTGAPPTPTTPATEPAPTPAPTEVAAATVTPVPASPTPAATLPAPTGTAPVPTNTAPAPPATPGKPSAELPESACRLGSGLRQQTAPIVLQYADHPALVMSATYGMAEATFAQLDGWIRVLGAPNLAELEGRAQRAQEAGLAYEGLGYGLETGKSTPDEEWQDLVGSTEKAKAIADKYGKLLVMGPGLRLMSQNEDKYAPMAAFADIWMFQTQRYQLDPPGPVFRQNVERVIGLIRAGNPDIKIWTQITLPPDREPDAEEWLAYRAAIADLVDGTYLGIYTWGKADEKLLVSAAEQIFAGACSGTP